MADDPRLKALSAVLDITPHQAMCALIAVDVVDPLRRLLADPDRFKALMDANWNMAGRVLAALREVAGAVKSIGNTGNGDREPVSEPRATQLREEGAEPVAWHHGHARCTACLRPLPHTTAELTRCPKVGEVANGG